MHSILGCQRAYFSLTLGFVPEETSPAAKKKRRDFVDLTGQTFGSYTVLSKVDRKHYWHCRCACGTERDLFGPDLKRGKTKSCGCVGPTPEAIAERSAKANATKAKSAARKAKREAAELIRKKARDEAKAREAAEKAKLAKIEEQKKTGKNVKYGFIFDEQANELSIELQCYRERLATGKPREFHFRKAFCMVWPAFQWNEWCEMMLWAWCNYRIVCVIGHSRASKTYMLSHLAFLDYLAAPPLTATTMTTTKFDALKTRMWGDLMRAIESVNPVIAGHIAQLFKVTSTSNEMRVGIDDPTKKGDDKFAIQGVATDSGDKTAGKIRGQHADRRRILGDEAQDIAAAIYSAFANASSAPDFIGGLLSNPVEMLSEFGKWCMPKGGWSSVHDTDLFWETETPGGICLHFDGLQSPNIKAGKTVFPYLLTQDYVDFIRKQYGEDSLEWWMYIRGFFPPDGVVSRIWASATIENTQAECDFDFEPEPCASLDPAYESDDPVLTLGHLGRLRDKRPCMNIKKQIRIQFKLGDKTQTKDRQLADAVKKECMAFGVKPENYIQDTTGNGRSVYALLFEDKEWGGPKIQKVEYGGAATKRPLRLNDPQPSEEQVKWFVAELWFRASYMAADGLFSGLKNLDPKGADDLGARRYTIKQDGDRKKMVIETKDELKKRLGRSPDYGDSLVQFGELMVRKGLINGITSGGSSGMAKRMKMIKKLAIKAAQRFSEKKEFSHGTA